MPTFEKYEKAVRLLIDTDVLIWFLRGRQSARRAIESCTTVEVSAVVYMELVQGVRDKAELQALRHTMRRSGWHILPLTEAIGHRATLYLETFALSHGLRLADALIAATAVEAGGTLLTANDRHYRCLADLALETFKP